MRARRQRPRRADQRALARRPAAQRHGRRAGAHSSAHRARDQLRLPLSPARRGHVLVPRAYRRTGRSRSLRGTDRRGSSARRRRSRHRAHVRGTPRGGRLAGAGARQRIAASRCPSAERRTVAPAVDQRHHRAGSFSQARGPCSVGHGDRRPADRTASRTRGPRGARTRQSCGSLHRRHARGRNGRAPGRRRPG